MEKLKIVVVDDKPIIRMDLKAMLHNAGYEVVGEGSDGFDAIELCKTKKPDVAILDIRMENLDGLSAAEFISKECPDVAIILLTAYSKGEYIDKAKECNIISYLVKPIDERALVPNIELAVARSKEMKNYRHDIDKANERLEHRKITEKAKGLLMSNKNITEQEAYEKIRELSKNRRMSMQKISEIIIKQYEG